MSEGPESEPTHFIEDIIKADIAEGKHQGRIQTRFPPEPNGYLHIGHAKTIFLNFGLAKKYNGLCNLRFDDTNPSKESVEFVEAIQRDVKWLGCDWDDRLFFASDYFEKLFDYAVKLINAGKAYVCDLTPEQMKEYRGTKAEPGKNIPGPGIDSPFRNRSVEENLDLFQRMRAGEFDEGSRSLRAKIDMAHPNLNMRDPVIYRIQKHHHHRTGDKWCIYPSYDFAHGQSDSMEGVTHSLCTLEFENHRPLYNWFIEQLEIFPSRQIEFAPLNLAQTVLSKRYINQLVDENKVSGYDDPRLPTIAGMRRRGYPAEALRIFCEEIGVTKYEGTIEMARLEKTLRDVLNEECDRVMCVLDPVKLILTNIEADSVEMMPAVNHMKRPENGSREMPFTRELFIERDDFMIDPPKKFFRLGPDRAVRLKSGYVIDCTGYKADENGRVEEIYATVDFDTRSGTGTSERKVKGTIHWVSASHAVDVEVRFYDCLLKHPDEVDADATLLEKLNPKSLVVGTGKIEPAHAKAVAGTRVQFERKGYFCVDPDSTDEKPIWNRIVSLRSSWKKAKKAPPKPVVKKESNKARKRRERREREEAARKAAEAQKDAADS